MPFLIGAFVLMLLFAVGYHYRNGLMYYFGFKSDNLSKVIKEKQRLSDVRNYTLLSKYKLEAVIIDISEY